MAVLQPVPKIAKERTDEDQRRIEAAARQLFNFPNKEAIFSSLAQRYRSHLDRWFRQAIGPLRDPLSKAGLRKLASAIWSELDAQREDFLMILSDMIEFKNQHFLEVFHDVPGQFRRVLRPALDQLGNPPQ